MNTLLDVSLQNSSPLRFVQSNDLQNLSGVEPIVRATTHDCNLLDDTFVNRYSRVGGLREGGEGRGRVDIERLANGGMGLEDGRRGLALKI